MKRKPEDRHYLNEGPCAVHPEEVCTTGKSKLPRRVDFMRNTLLLLCVFAMSCASQAQSDKASWANLSTLQTGQKIQIVDMNANKHSGTFLNVSDTAVRYQDNAGDQSIPKPDVRRVKLMENRHRLRHTLIGAGVGAGVGAVIGAVANHPCVPNPPSQQFPNCLGANITRGDTAGIGAVVGFLAGAVVGALVPTHSTIYSVSAN
jgi:hypothetical protein